jgi:hypothetical protein
MSITEPKREFMPLAWVQLGRVAQLLELKCTRHFSLLEGLTEHTRVYPELELSICLYDDFWVCLLIGLPKKKEIWTLNFRYSLPCEISGLSTPGTILNQQWISPELLRSWMQRCSQGHGEVCSSYTRKSAFSAARPTWLLDTWLQCVTPAAGISSYLALSYVWGRNISFVATKNNIAQLQLPYSLSVTRAPNIPRTIRDTMGLTELLRQRYLWVDTLCIVQDDEKAKHSEVANMAGIYANALVTIIAADGNDAESGLHGLYGISRPRLFTQKSHAIGKGIRLIHRTDRDTSMNRHLPRSNRWRNRGWTFQEYHCSRKRILFHDDTVHWECGCAHWDEDCHVALTSAMDGNEEINIHSVLSDGFPSIHAFAFSVESYNDRILTFPQDALFGFAGITSGFASLFQGGFVSGLPTSWFHIALLWQAETHLDRRVAKDSASDYVCLPS